MVVTQTKEYVQDLIKKVGELTEEYGANQADAFADGNVAICIIDEDGNMNGKIWGTNKVTGRNFYKNAWVKASQVWITNMRTGEFEKSVYAEKINEEDYGLAKPDLIGWEGGQPITLPNGKVISVGFSGYRGFNDIEIVQKALKQLQFE
jgi:glc operon protein GlcG